ncbi:MAG: SOS response-associated peptidase [Halanaerobiales bacterium]
MINICGRYYLMLNLDNLRRWYNIEKDDNIDYSPPGEIYPAQKAPVIVGKKPQLKIFRWGFTPSYTNRPVINARGETVDQKNLFQNSFYNRRCLIPGNAFFEWKKKGNEKIKMKIGHNEEKIFSMAGLFQTFNDSKGNPVKCFTILTTEASNKIKKIHNRMPVILDKENENKWINPDTPTKKLKDLIKPYKDQKLYIKKDNPDKKDQLSFNFD